MTIDVREVVRRAGGVGALSARLGITHQAVYGWIKQGWVPLRHAMLVQRLSGVSRDKFIDPRLLRALAEADATDVMWSDDSLV